jgi:DNA-binding CsgD family transcriptional regulator
MTIRRDVGPRDDARAAAQTIAAQIVGYPRTTAGSLGGTFTLDQNASKLKPDSAPLIVRDGNISIVKARQMRAAREITLARYPAQPQTGDPQQLDAYEQQTQISARELDVLALLASGKSNQAIADTLIIGINTVKMHLRHIYAKLDAHNRVQAIIQARALDLVP